MRLVACFGSKGVDLEKAPDYLDVVKHPIGECSFSITGFSHAESRVRHFTSLVTLSRDDGKRAMLGGRVGVLACILFSRIF